MNFKMENCCCIREVQSEDVEASYDCVQLQRNRNVWWLSLDMVRSFDVQMLKKIYVEIKISNK